MFLLMSKLQNCIHFLNIEFINVYNSELLFPIDTTPRTTSVKTQRETPFFSDTEASFNNAVWRHDHWFVQWQQINQWRQRSCTAYGWKARQNGRGIWLYNAGIRQGSSDFFSFTDNYKIFALRDSKPSPLNEPSQRIQTSLCSADSPLLSSSWSTDSLPLSDNSLLRELLYKRANFCGVIGNAALFLSFVTPLHAADKHASVFHAWAPPMLKQWSPRRNVTTAVT